MSLWHFCKSLLHFLTRKMHFLFMKKLVSSVWTDWNIFICLLKVVRFMFLFFIHFPSSWTVIYFLIFFYKNCASFTFIFVFTNEHYKFYNIYVCEKITILEYSCWIRTHNLWIMSLLPWPLDHCSHPLNPKLTFATFPTFNQFYFCKMMLKKGHSQNDAFGVLRVYFFIWSLPASFFFSFDFLIQFNVN